ncbi:MAG: NAD(P)-dependent oxidoreductase [Geobacteraceae bacterium]|nr:NAD(P)-dependent oxidoreductase [Geobacteraceae bacterium]
MRAAVNGTLLVTGATGFVGSHLVRRLLADGWKVHLIVRAGSPLKLVADLETRLTVHRYHGTAEDLSAIVRQAAPDLVFHLASLFLAQHRPEDIEPLICSNVLFPVQLLEAMTANGCHRLVNAGTSWQHYRNSGYSPVNLYAASKQAFEVLMQYYLETTPLQAVTLKLFDTYGPGDPRPKLIKLLGTVARQSAPLAMSPGEQLIDLVHIDDVVEAFVLAGERLLDSLVEGHENFPVSSGRPLSLRELVAIYEKILGKKLPLEWGGRPYRPREVMVPWNDGRPLPGWRPRVGLEQGLAGIIESGENC